MGGSEFKILDRRTDNEIQAKYDEDRGESEISDHVIKSRYMGLTAHRYYAKDKVMCGVHKCTKVMVSLQNEFSGRWRIERRYKETR